MARGRIFIHSIFAEFGALSISSCARDRDAKASALLSMDQTTVLSAIPSSSNFLGASYDIAPSQSGIQLDLIVSL